MTLSGRIGFDDLRIEGNLKIGNENIDGITDLIGNAERPAYRDSTEDVDDHDDPLMLGNISQCSQKAPAGK